MTKNNKRVSITEQVISSIAGMSAAEIEGVSGLRGNVADNLKAIFGDEARSRGVISKEGDDGTVQITIHVAIEYGYPIHEVAQRVQKRVKEDVSEMTGLYVTAVDVYVSDLTIPTHDELDDDAHEELEHNGSSALTGKADSRTEDRSS